MLKGKISYQIEIEAAEIIINCLDEAKKTLKNFDRKMFNKRVNEAFNKPDQGYIYIRKNDYSEKLELNVSTDISKEIGNYNTIWPEVFRRWTVCNLIDEKTKRIDYKRCEDLINDEIERIKIHVGKIEAADMEKIQEEKGKIKKMVDDFNQGLDGVSYRLFYIKNY